MTPPAARHPKPTVTRFRHHDLAQEGVRGVGGEVGMTAKLRAYDSILVIEAEGGGSEIERPAPRPGPPTIDITFVREGEFSYREDGAWIASRAALVVAPTGLPRRVLFPGPWRFVVARIPRELVVPHLPALSDRVSPYAELTIPERAMMAFLLQTIADDEQPASEAECHTIARLVVEMAGALLRHRQGEVWRAGAPQAVLRDRAFAVIARESADARLVPESIARQLGVSLRHLQEVFADAGGSVASEIRQERARSARALLQDGLLDGLSIAEVAARAGFGSTASMRRALEANFGSSPTELRRRRRRPTE